MRLLALGPLLSLAGSVLAAPLPSPSSLQARAQVLSETIDWPTAVKAGGNAAYQYQLTPAGGGALYTVQFFNTQPPNRVVTYKYVAKAVGAGADGSSVSKTLATGESASLSLVKSGTQVQVTIEYL